MEDVLSCSRLYSLAAEYLETLERDKRIVAARYVARFRERPTTGRDMGFVQFVESKLNSEQNSA